MVCRGALVSVCTYLDAARVFGDRSCWLLSIAKEPNRRAGDERLNHLPLRHNAIMFAWIAGMKCLLTPTLMSPPPHKPFDHPIFPTEGRKNGKNPYRLCAKQCEVSLHRFGIANRHFGPQLLANLRRAEGIHPNPFVLSLSKDVFQYCAETSTPSFDRLRTNGVSYTSLSPYAPARAARAT